MPPREAWHRHAQAAETALARGDPGLARRELERAVQAAASAPGGVQLPKVRERPSPTDEDDDEDYEDDQGAWLADLGAALEQAEAEPMQQRPFSNMHQERINDLQGHGSRLTGNLPEVPTAGRYTAQASTEGHRETIQRIVEALGISNSDECTDFVMSLLEDIELELEQGETREQMIEDVLKSAIESARGAAENVSNDAGIAKKIEEAVPQIIGVQKERKNEDRLLRRGLGDLDTARAGNKAAMKGTYARQAWAESGRGGWTENSAPGRRLPAANVTEESLEEVESGSKRADEAKTKDLADPRQGLGDKSETSERDAESSSGAQMARVESVRIRRPKKKGVNRWAQSKRDQLKDRSDSLDDGLRPPGAAAQNTSGEHKTRAIMSADGETETQVQPQHGKVIRNHAALTSDTDQKKLEPGRANRMAERAQTGHYLANLRDMRMPNAVEKADSRAPDLLYFWGVERFDMPVHRRYKGELAQRISDRAFSGQVIEGNVSLLMSVELRARKAVEQLVGGEKLAGVMPGAADRGRGDREEEMFRMGVGVVLTQKERQMDRERERERERCRVKVIHRDSTSQRAAYQELQLNFRRVEELATNAGFSGFAGSIARTLARTAAALRLTTVALQHWREAQELASQERDARAEIRALIGCAECLCGAREFAEAERQVEAALALAEKSSKALEEEDRLCVLRARMQVQDAWSTQSLEQAERSLISNHLQDALQLFQLSAGAALRGLETAHELACRQRKVVAKRNEQKSRDAGKGKDMGASKTESRLVADFDHGIGGTDWAAHVDDYNAVQCDKIMRRLSKSRYKALAASACCMMKVGLMNEAIDVWKEVLTLAEALTGETEALEGRVASLENLATAHEVLGNLQQSVLFAHKASGLKIKLEGVSEEALVGAEPNKGPDAESGGKKTTSSMCLLS